MSGSESSSDSKVEKNKPKLNTIIRQLYKALVDLTQCPISTEPYSEKNPPVFSTGCGHTFGKKSSSQVTECPFCREPIAKIETNYAIKGMLEICEKLKSAIRIKLQELENSKDHEVEITGLRQEIEYLMEKLKQKGIEIEKLNSLLSETKDAMQQEIDILKLDNQKLRANLRNSQNINTDLTRQLAEAKQQVTLEKPKPNKPSEESSEGFDAKHLLSGPRERKGKGKKSKGNLSVSESPEQRAAAHDAKPLPAKVESVLPREKEAKAAGRGPNWFKVVTAGILSVVSVVSFVEGAVFTFRGVRRLTSQPGSMADNQQEPTNTTSITPSISAPNITSIADLKPHLSALLTTNPESALPDLAKVFCKVLTPEQFSQLIKEFESQQTATAVDKPKEKVIAEQPTNGLKAEDTSALKQQFELEAMDVPSASRATTDSDEQSVNVPDKNEEQTTAKPSVLPVQAEVDNNSSTAVGKVNEVKGSSLESQEERFKTSEQYMMSGDPVLIPKGNDLLIVLAEEGYPPAQLKRGIHMVFAGHYIAREDLINKGLALMQAAAGQKYQKAIDYLRDNNPKQAKVGINTVVKDTVGKKWRVSEHLEKRFQVLVEKVYGGSSEGFSSPQNQQSKDEAFSELEKLARVENYAPAQYCLGYSFLFAGKYLNSPAFIGRGIMWLEKAAKQGAKNAIDLLATDFFTKDHFSASQQSSGTGDNDDFSRAVHAYKICEHGIQAFNKNKPKESFAFFSQAAELGNGLAQYFLAQQYETAYGVPRDLSLAAQLYEAAVTKGVRQAYVELGIFYKEGRGVKKDWSIARSLFQQALDSPATIELPGSVGGGSYLEKINQADNSYQSGLKLLASNTPSDNLWAAEQFRIAAVEGHEDAQRVLEECFSSTAKGIERIGTCDRFNPTVPEQETVQAGEAKSLPIVLALNDVGLFSESAVAQNVAPSPQKLSSKEIADLRRDIKESCPFITPKECYEKMVKLADQIKIGATVALPEDFSVTTSVPGVMPSLYKPKQTKEWYADTLKYYARMLYTNADLNKGYSYRN